MPRRLPGCQGCFRNSPRILEKTPSVEGSGADAGADKASESVVANSRTEPYRCDGSRANPRIRTRSTTGPKSRLGRALLSEIGGWDSSCVNISRGDFARYGKVPVSSAYAIVAR